MAITQFDGYPHDGRVYLVKLLTVDAGFYVCDGEPIYAIRLDDASQRSDVVETIHLRLMLSAELVLVDGAQGDTSQRFDIIRLTSWDDPRELVAFSELCSMHATEGTSLSFKDFFYALNDLFQPAKRQQRLDAVGLFGELSCIDYCKQSGIDLSEYWQMGGYYSKYDFSLPYGNIEVKTSLGMSFDVLIKHEQFFNGDTNCLAYVSIERNTGGESLASLSTRLLNSSNCFKTLRAQLELNKRLLRISDKELNAMYRPLALRCYWAKDINFVGECSDRVTQLTYRLNLASIAAANLRCTVDALLLGGFS